eukprot:5144186-Amphidinium_carterae.2
MVDAQVRSTKLQLEEEDEEERIERGQLVSGESEGSHEQESSACDQELNKSEQEDEEVDAACDIEQVREHKVERQDVDRPEVEEPSPVSSEVGVDQMSDTSCEGEAAAENPCESLTRDQEIGILNTQVDSTKDTEKHSEGRRLARGQDDVAGVQHNEQVPETACETCNVRSTNHA